MGQLFADAARAYLSAGINNTDTTISIASGGTLFPVANGTDWFKAVLQDASGIEIVYVTAHTSGSTSFTVTRGQEGTTARSFAVGAVFGIRVTSADMAGFAEKLPDAPSDGKTYGRKDAAWAEVVSGGAGPRNWYVSQHTASGTFVVPSGVTVIRPYAFGAGAAGTTTSSGGGGGCAYGDIAVTPGATVTLSIAAGVAKVTYGGVDLLTANPASGVTGGTASKHGSVANGGAYPGGNGAASVGGASSGSPLGAGVNGSAAGGSGWGGAGGGSGGGGVGAASSGIFGGSGLPSPSTDPLLEGLIGAGATAGVSYGGSGSPGGGGGAGFGPTNSNGQGGVGGFGGGGGPGVGNGTGGSGYGGPGGFGGGGGRGSGGTGTSQSGGAGGFGGGGGQGANAGGAGGAAVIRIYY